MLEEYALNYKDEYAELCKFMYDDVKIDNYDSMPTYAPGSSESTHHTCQLKWR